LCLKDFRSILHKFPGRNITEISDSAVKVPTGWLIEQAGFKGKRFETQVFTKPKHWFLVNYGNATGQEIPSRFKGIYKILF
jgi:UDP-N-acetylmuramate dehydrogenase